MRCLWSVIAAVVVACTTSASAQVQSVSRVASGEPDTDIRVGVYVNVRPDCTSGPLPSIQLTSPPENGKVTVKKARVTATNYKQCLALEVSGWQDASGADQCYGWNWIARATQLNGRINWSWRPRVDKPIDRDRVRRIRRRDRRRNRSSRSDQ